MMTVACAVIAVIGLFKWVGKSRVLGLILVAIGVFGWIGLCIHFGGVSKLLEAEMNLASGGASKIADFFSKGIDFVIEKCSGIWDSVYGTVKHILGIETSGDRSGMGGA